MPHPIAKVWFVRDTSWYISRPCACSEWRLWAASADGPKLLNFNDLGDCERIFKFDAQVSDFAVHLGLSKQKPNRPQAAGLLVNLGYLCSPYRMRAVGTRLNTD